MEPRTYKKYHLTDSREVLSAVLSEETLDYVAKNNIKGSFFAFVGVDEIIYSANLQEHEVVLPPVGPVPVSITSDCRLYRTVGGDEFYDFTEFFPDEYFGIYANRVIYGSHSRIKNRDIIFESPYRNFILINEFLNDKNIDPSMTIIEFYKQNRNHVEKAILEGSSKTVHKALSYNLNLLNRDLVFIEKKSLFWDLNQDNLIKFLDLSYNLCIFNTLIKPSSKISYFCYRNINDLADLAKSNKEIKGGYAHEQAQKDLLKALCDLVAPDNQDASESLFNKLSKEHNALESLYGIVVLIGVFNTSRLIKTIQNSASNFSPYELFILVLFFANEHLFVVCESELFNIYELVLKILEQADKYQALFDFIKEMALSYTGPSPREGELTEAINSDIDFSLGPDLIIPFISASPLPLKSTRVNQLQQMREILRQVELYTE